MTSISYSDYNPLLKNIYAADVSDVTFKDNPLLALLPKAKDLGGVQKNIPIKLSAPQGISADITQALKRARLKGTTSRNFTIPGEGKKFYGCASIPTTSIKGSLNDKQAFMKLMTFEIDGIMAATSHVLNTFLYRSGFGDLGVVGSVSSATITLATPEDAYNFEVGMELDTAADQGTSARRTVGSSTNGLIVTGVSLTNGVGLLTFAYNVTDATNGIPNTAAGDYIFLRSCRSDSVLTTDAGRLVVDGLAAWCPATAPSTSESFHGVDRSGNSRLFGLYLDASSTPLNEALTDADMLVTAAGGKLSHFMMHPKTYAKLAKLLESKVQIVKTDMVVSPKVSFQSIGFVGMNGLLKLVADRSCPVNTIWGLEMDSWLLNTMGEVVSPIDFDGNTVLRGTDDSVEFRSGFYGELSCNAPGHNIQIRIS